MSRRTHKEYSAAAKAGKALADDCDDRVPFMEDDEAAEAPQWDDTAEGVMFGDLPGLSGLTGRRLV